MKIRFQGDYDLKRAIIIGLKRKVPAISFRNADESGLRGLDDEKVLAIAAQEGRVLVSHDRRTLPSHFARFIDDHQSPGVILIDQPLPIKEAIDELELIWEASQEEEWIDRLEFIPL